MHCMQINTLLFCYFPKLVHISSTTDMFIKERTGLVSEEDGRHQHWLSDEWPPVALTLRNAQTWKGTQRQKLVLLQDD